MDLLQKPQSLPADVFITAALDSRPAPRPDYRMEKDALQRLVASMAQRPEAILPEFVQLAMVLTNGVSAGLSLLEEAGGVEVFRWHHLVGLLSPFEGATTPRNESPCGVTVDACSPVLTRHPERHYAWVAEAGIVLPEVLLVPLLVGESGPVGTLWIVSDTEGHFHAEHARSASELASLAAAALRTTLAEKQLREALAEQELLTRELNHRVKNVFALIDSMIRFSARGQGDKDQMAVALSGRLHALASAHALVMNEAVDGAASLGGLLDVVLKPYAGVNGEPRFAPSGPAVRLSEAAINGLSLVLHELATNAAKYGALCAETGFLNIAWTTRDKVLEIVWAELGDQIPTPPAQTGFGTRLIDMAITRQLKGSIAYDWRRTGLVVTMTIPTEQLAR
jgi:two-component sensor histidine kinase